MLVAQFVAVVLSFLCLHKKFIYRGCISPSFAVDADDSDPVQCKFTRPGFWYTKHFAQASFGLCAHRRNFEYLHLCFHTKQAHIFHNSPMSLWEQECSWNRLLITIQWVIFCWFIYDLSYNYWLLSVCMLHHVTVFPRWHVSQLSHPRAIWWHFTDYMYGNVFAWSC